MNNLVATNLKILRAARGLNQTQAGAVIGVSQQTWARYEKGEVEITVNLLGEIAEKFGVSVSQFFELASFHSSKPQSDNTEMIKKSRSKRSALKASAR